MMFVFECRGTVDDDAESIRIIDMQLSVMQDNG